MLRCLDEVVVARCSFNHKNSTVLIHLVERAILQTGLKVSLLPADLPAAFVEMQVPREEQRHACVHQMRQDRQVLLLVIVAAFVLVLFAAEDGVMRVADDSVAAQELLGLRGELQLEESHEVAELLLELLVEEAGVVAVPAQPREEVLARVAKENVAAELDHVEVAVEVRPRGRVEGVSDQLEDVLVFDALVVA